MALELVGPVDQALGSGRGPGPPSPSRILEPGLVDGCPELAHTNPTARKSSPARLPASLGLPRSMGDLLLG